MQPNLIPYLNAIPEGYSETLYQGKKYSLTKRSFNQGKSIKIFAKELAGKDFISLNFYQLSKQSLLKPCEMPEKKVIHFLMNHIITK